MTDDFPALAPEFLNAPTPQKLAPARVSTHPPRFLLLCTSPPPRVDCRQAVRGPNR